MEDLTGNKRQREEREERERERREGYRHEANRPLFGC